MKSNLEMQVSGKVRLNKAVLGFALFTLTSVPAWSANTSVGTARVIAPDGTSLFQVHGGSTRWFAFGAEPGKTYTVEVLDPYGDLGSNAIGAVGIFASDGTSGPPEAQTNCAQAAVSPSLDVSGDGVRCIVRTFTPQSGSQNKRGIYISVGAGQGINYQLRVRESTIYGRWTTNGYDFHVELQNTSADALCAQVLFYPNAGGSFTGTWSIPVGTVELAVPAFGANKYIYPNGTAVGSDLRGTLRIQACPGTVNFNPSQVHVSTYAYNPVTDKYLYFFATPANGGAASNSW